MLPQDGEVTVDRLPHDLQVNIKVVVNDAIAHSVYQVPRDVSMTRREIAERAWFSYRNRFEKHPIAKCFWKTLRRKHVHPYAQEAFRFELNCRERE